MAAFYEMDTVYFPLIGVAFTAFMAIYILGPYLSARWCSNYKTLTTEDRLTFDNKLSSMIHSIIVSTICLVCYFVESDDFFKWKLLSNSALVETNMCIVIGYMVADTIHMLLYHKYLATTEFILHHMASIWAFVYLLSLNQLAWFCNFRITAEISTFFINLRWFVDKPFKYSKKSNVYIVTALMLSATFILTRIVTIPIYYYLLYSECRRHTCTPAMFFWAIVPPLVLDGLSLWWTRRLVAGFKKIIYQGWFKDVVLKNYVNNNEEKVD